MENLADLPLGIEPEVGQLYLVPCLDYSKVTLVEGLFPRLYKYQHLLVDLPILGHMHADPEFPGAGGETPHTHIDLRFLDDKASLFIWGNDYQTIGQDSFPILPRALTVEPVPISFHAKRCLRRLADTRQFRISGLHYIAFENRMEKLSIDLANPICPHHGTSLRGMCVRDGVVTCPLHGATWCAKTGHYVRKTRHFREGEQLGDSYSPNHLMQSNFGSC